MPGFLQQAIHGGKCLSRVDGCRRENPVAGQTVMETPGEEDGLVRLVIVRKSSPIEGHTWIVRREGRFLTKEKVRPGGRRAQRAPPRGSAPPRRSNPHHF